MSDSEDPISWRRDFLAQTDRERGEYNREFRESICRIQRKIHGDATDDTKSIQWKRSGYSQGTRIVPETISRAPKLLDMYSIRSDRILIECF